MTTLVASLRPEDWHRLNHLLEHALELEPVERGSWLETLDSEPGELLTVLRQLLEQRQSFTPGDWPTTGVTPEGWRTHLMALPMQPGARVGPYRLLRELGQGGMATVWLAERADGAFTREVALKLPMLARMRKDLAPRFVRERDILASLEHPNIARLYDAGVEPDGLPYLAMEYVQGLPLTEWCDSRKLGLRARLVLFLQVLDALRYAHERQVIHRDLKPSNILVTESGQVRLLDFGIAKLLEEETAGERTELTRFYGRALTPEYASPELLRGEAVGEASDIYSLGVLLYELMSGGRPHRVKAGASLGTLEHAIATEAVRRPSTQVEPDAAAARACTPAKLVRHLQGDLDAIALKALEREPRDRYARAGEMADDLRRYLAGQPVRAQPARLSYRLRKYILRNRLAAGLTAVAALLAFVGFTLGRGIAERNAAAPPGAAAPAAIASIAVLPFTDLSEQKDQEYLADGLAAELIDLLANSPGLKVISRRSSFQFKDGKEDVRTIAEKLGVAVVLEGSVRRTADTVRVGVQLIRASDGSHLWAQTFERSTKDIFRVQDEIARSVTRTLNVSLRPSSGAARGREPDVQAYNLMLKGRFFLFRSDKADSRKAVELFEQALRLDPDYAMAWALLGNAYFNEASFGWIPFNEGMEKARRALARALALDPGLFAAHFTLAAMHADFEWDWAGAQAEIDRMREIDPNEGVFSPFIEANLDLIFGRLDEAVATYHEILNRDPLYTFGWRSLAYALLLSGRYEESVAAQRELLELSPRFASAQSMTGQALMLLGRYDEARAAIAKEPDDDQRLSMLPVLDCAQGRRAEADEARRHFEREFGSRDPYSMAQIQSFCGNADEAFRWLDLAYRQHQPDLVFSRSDPLLRNLRPDPRFHALLVKMRIEGTGPQARPTAAAGTPAT